MIQRAIAELNEQGGSSEEAISKFIEAEYEDLPFAHVALLTCHLQKLVIKGKLDQFIKWHTNECPKYISNSQNESSSIQ